MTNKEFLATMGNYARADMALTGVLASMTIAQAILESGWGKSGLAIGGCNLFGIKATSAWQGKVYSTETNECYDGVNLVRVDACFKAYSNWGESIADHSALITKSARYAKVVGETNYKVACQEIKNAGYATDPAYPAKLITLIEQHKLYEYDVKTDATESKGEITMGNSSLISGTILSPNKSTRKGTISKIAIHCMAGGMTAKSCGNLFSQTKTGASSHYGIGSDDLIYLYVNESDRAWCTGGKDKDGNAIVYKANGKTGGDIDNMAVTIEVANSVKAEPWPVTDKSYSLLLDLVEDIARRNGITEVTYNADGSGTLQAHRWYAIKACPGDYLMERFPDIARTVSARLKGQAVAPSTVTETTAPTTGEFKVRVTDDSLNIRTGGSVNSDIVGTITDRGVYTIVEERGGWGKLKSGAGWISLHYTQAVS